METLEKGSQVFLYPNVYKVTEVMDDGTIRVGRLRFQPNGWPLDGGPLLEQLTEATEARRAAYKKAEDLRILSIRMRTYAQPEVLIDLIEPILQERLDVLAK